MTIEGFFPKLELVETLDPQEINPEEKIVMIDSAGDAYVVEPHPINDRPRFGSIAAKHFCKLTVVRQDKETGETTTEMPFGEAPVEMYSELPACAAPNRLIKFSEISTDELVVFQNALPTTSRRPRIDIRTLPIIEIGVG